MALTPLPPGEIRGQRHRTIIVNQTPPDSLLTISQQSPGFGIKLKEEGESSFSLNPYQKRVAEGLWGYQAHSSFILLKMRRVS